MNINLFTPKHSKLHIEDLMKKQLNLYPYKNGRLSNKAKRIRIVLLTALAGLSCIFFYTGYLYMQNGSLLSEIAVRSANLQVENDRLNNQKMLDELMNRIEYKSNLLQFIDKTNTSATLVIETIERNVSNEIQYVNLDFISDNTIRISCQTSNTEWIAKLVHQLKNENFFDTVFVESITLNQDLLNTNNKSEYEFQLICTFGGSTNETQK